MALDKLTLERLQMYVNMGDRIGYYRLLAVLGMLPKVETDSPLSCRDGFQVAVKDSPAARPSIGASRRRLLLPPSRTAVLAPWRDPCRRLIGLPGRG